MIVTGRRAWRKWLKRRRRLFCKLSRSLGIAAKSAGSQARSCYSGPVSKRLRKSSEGRGPRKPVPSFLVFPRR